MAHNASEKKLSLIDASHLRLLTYPFQARHKEDNANNSGKYLRLMPDGSTTEVKSSELKAGWIVRINESQQFPSGSKRKRRRETRGKREKRGVHEKSSVQEKTYNK
jgi:hypothetical protein